MCGGRGLGQVFGAAANLVDGGGWTGFRDDVESAASLAGNYALPGSSLVTDNLVSKGSEKTLDSTLGKVAQFATGAAGGGVGESLTGIPSAAEEGAGWTNAANAAGGLVGQPSLGTNISSSVSNIFGGTGGGASTAAPASVSGGTSGDVTSQLTDAFNQGQGTNYGAGGATGGGSPFTTAADTANVGSGASKILDTGSLDSFGTGGDSAASPTSTNYSTPSSSSNVAQTVGSPNVSSGTKGLVDNFSAEQAANAPVTDSLSPKVIADSNAASPGGVDTTLNQQGFLAKNLGGSALVPQGSTPISQAVGGVNSGTTNSIAKAWEDPSTSNILSAIGNNAGPLASVGGLAATALMGNKKLPGEDQIRSEADKLATQGDALQNYLQTGTLPAGLQNALTQASKSAEAAIRSEYAAHGMSGSSAEQDALARVKENVSAQGSQMALQLLQTGIGESQGAAQLYQGILSSALQQDNNLGSAIGRFASSFAGGGNVGGHTIQIS